MILHFLTIIFTSFISTTLLFPISLLDTYYIASFNKYPFYLTLPFLIIIETIMAWIIFKLSKLIVHKVVTKKETKQKVINIGNKLGKYGWWLILVSATTPLPYSLVIYAAGSVDWGNNTKFITAVAIGRTIKYVVISLGLYYGWQLIK